MAGGGSSGEGFGGSETSGFGYEGGGGRAGYGGVDPSGYGIEGGGGYGGYGGAFGAGSPAFGPALSDYTIPGPLNPRDIERAPPEDPRGFDVGRALQKALAWAAQYAPPPAVPAALGLQLGLAKALGMPDEELNNLAGYGITNFATGGLLGATQKLGQGAQWAAKALGAQGGPQPGSGEQASSGGFGGLDPGSAAAAQGLAQRVFAVPAQKRAQILAQLERGAPVFGPEPGREYGNQ
jgi:hypothetical protein